MHYDLIVVGLGAVGSAALYQLARRGIRALGLDRFQPPHDRGSSHGESRITRLALGEGAQYVQFASRSHEIWRELEAATGQHLLEAIGGLVFGSPTQGGPAHGAADFLRTTVEVARRHGIGHELLGSAALPERFPQFRFRGDEAGYFEPEAGFLRPERCIAAQLQMAVRMGAEVRAGERLLSWEADGGGVRVVTDRGRYETGGLLLCTGAWLPPCIPGLETRARVLRQVLFWFEPDGPPAWFTPDRLPVYICLPGIGAQMLYGFPAISGPGGGVKVAGEQFDHTCDPDAVKEKVEAEEIAAMHRLAATHLRVTSRCVRTVVCKYTVTPDFGFVIDRHPDSDRVWFASACSGHGFKHSAAVGEALAELASEGRNRFDLSPFRLIRALARATVTGAGTK